MPTGGGRAERKKGGGKGRPSSTGRKLPPLVSAACYHRDQSHVTASGFVGHTRSLNQQCTFL